MMAALLRNKKPAPKKAESPVSISGVKAPTSALEKDKLSMTVPATGSANAKDFVSAFDASLTVGHPMRKTRSNNNMNNKEVTISPAPVSSWPDSEKDKDVDMAKEKTDGDFGFGYWGQPQKQESIEARPETLITSDSEMTVAMPNLYRGISTIKPEAPIKKLIAKRKTLLMPQRKQDEGKLTVVLDLDETLIHSEFTGQDRFRQAEADRMHASGRRKPDFSITLYENDPNQEEEVVHVYKRPGLENFLKKLSEICEPVIFTAALPMYARPILKQIDPKRRCKSRLYRNATIQYRGYPHVKSLKNLGRDLGRSIIVDNSPYAMCADPDNAIPIKAYYDDLEDRELEYLYEIIAEMVQMADVRPHLRRKFAFAQTLAQIMDSN